MKYIPAGAFALFAAVFFLMTFAGDNSDARALSGIMAIPGIICTAIAIVAAVIAWCI